MKVQEWEMWPGLFTIASDDGRVSFERDSTGSLCVEARYTDYTRGLSGQDEMTSQQVEPEMLAECLRRLGWTVAPPAPSAPEKLETPHAK